MIKQVTKMTEFVRCYVFDLPFMSTEFTRKMFHRLYIVIVLLKILMLIVNKEKKTLRELEICDIPSILEYDAFIFFQYLNLTSASSPGFLQLSVNYS